MIEVDRSLIAFLQHEEERSRQAALSEERSVALDFYNGEPFGDEEDGRSQLVTRDVSEVVDHMVINVMRTMVSGDRVVEFEALEEEAEEAVAEATEAIAQQFMNEQDGYQVLHDALKAGLLEKTGIIKTYAEKQPDKRTEHIVPAEMLSQLQTRPHEAEPVDPANEYGDWRIVMLEPQPPRFCDIAVPNEETLIPPDVREPDKAIYLAHKTRKTLSELREMGFEDVDGLEIGGLATNTLEVSRDYPTTQIRDERDGANATVWLLEEYIRYDLNGDGIAETLIVHRVGNQVLDINELDEQPLTIWCPIPMQHRLIGQSVADKVMDVQRTRSVLLRQFMDGTYQSTAPRTLIHEQSMGDSTIDDLLTVRPGALIRWKGTEEPKPFMSSFNTGPTLDALQIMTDERENRTGMVKMNQGLDADAINKTATGMAMQAEQNAQMEEYLARNFANAVGKMFAKKYRLMRAHGSPFKIRVDGQFKQVDPKQWPEQMRVRVKVGLGSGRKDARLAYRSQLLEIQKECIMGGLTEIVGPEQIYNSVKGFVKDTGLGDPNDFVKDPTVPELDEQGQPVQKQPKPDPHMTKVQAEAEVHSAAQQAQAAMDQQKLQGTQAMQAAEMQHAHQMAEFNAQQAQADAEGKLDLMHRTATAEQDLARQKAAFEADLAQQKADAEYALAQRRMSLEVEMAAHKRDLAEQDMIHKNRPGGALDA